MRQCLNCLEEAVDLYDSQSKTYKCLNCGEIYTSIEYYRLRPLFEIRQIDTSIIYDPIEEDYTVKRIRT